MKTFLGFGQVHKSGHRMIMLLFIDIKVKYHLQLCLQSGNSYNVGLGLKDFPANRTKTSKKN